MKAFILRWGPALLMMATIFTFSSIPSADMPKFGGADTLIKKMGHATGYAILLVALTRGFKPTNQRSLLACWFWLVLFAMSDEFHQYFVPGRNASWVDVGIDSLGGLVGLAGVSKWKFLRKVAGISTKSG
jgi:VanZ family protein